ncbi:MAG TPA: hypothetical protein VK659_06500, partial [Asanoa sp.]|nr:hypothetical protein [Asanoa sp.]
AAGLGATEVARRDLSAEEMLRIVLAEAADRRAAAAQYERLGQIDAAARMRSSADLLSAIVDAS